MHWCWNIQKVHPGSAPLFPSSLSANLHFLLKLPVRSNWSSGVRSLTLQQQGLCRVCVCVCGGGYFWSKQLWWSPRPTRPLCILSRSLREREPLNHVKSIKHGRFCNCRSNESLLIAAAALEPFTAAPSKTSKQKYSSWKHLYWQCFGAYFALFYSSWCAKR